MFHEIKFTLLYFFFMIRHHFIVSIMIFFCILKFKSQHFMAYFLRIETMYDDPPRISPGKKVVRRRIPPSWFVVRVQVQNELLQKRIRSKK